MDQKLPDAPLDKQSPQVAPQAVLVYKPRLDGIDFIKKQHCRRVNRYGIA